jgi:hypothetical protein
LITGHTFGTSKKERKKKGWITEDVIHTITESDIYQKASPPSIKFMGRTMLYIFEGKY